MPRSKKFRKLFERAVTPGFCRGNKRARGRARAAAGLRVKRGGRAAGGGGFEGEERRRTAGEN